VRIQSGNRKSDGRVGGSNPDVGSSFSSFFFFFFSELLRDGLENKNVQAIKVISNFV